MAIHFSAAYSHKLSVLRRNADRTRRSNVIKETKVVIIGGGIVGCSVAYHLAKLGWKDVVLLEQNQLAGGTTWHAAGLVGRLRTTNSMTKINKYSVELYAGLERETGQDRKSTRLNSSHAL